MNSELLLGSALNAFQVVGVGQQHRDGIAVPGRLDLFTAETNQRLACFHFIAFPDQAGEAVALHVHRIHADVDQHFHAVGFNADRVLALCHGGDDAVERGYHQIVLRFDADAVAQHTGSKGVIRDRFTRDDLFVVRLVSVKKPASRTAYGDIADTVCVVEKNINPIIIIIEGIARIKNEII